MANLKSTFPNLLPPDVKKYLPAPDSYKKKSNENIDKEKKEEETKLPLFYPHKIRAAKYEYL